MSNAHLSELDELEKGCLCLSVVVGDGLETTL